MHNNVLVSLFCLQLNYCIDPSSHVRREKARDLILGGKVNCGARSEYSTHYKLLLKRKCAGTSEGVERWLGRRMKDNVILFNLTKATIYRLPTYVNVYGRYLKNEYEIKIALIWLNRIRFHYRAFNVFCNKTNRCYAKTKKFKAKVLLWSFCIVLDVFSIKISISYDH